MYAAVQTITSLDFNNDVHCAHAQGLVPSSEFAQSTRISVLGRSLVHMYSVYILATQLHSSQDILNTPLY